MSDDDFLCCFSLENNVLLKEPNRTKTRVNEFNLNRFRGEFFTPCVPRWNYPDMFREYCRMSIETLDYILGGIFIKFV